MTSGQRTIRTPALADLHVEPPLGPLLLLEPELAATMTANALRVHYVAIEGDFFPGDTDEITTARVLARECDDLVEPLNDYRRRVWARLARQRSPWPF
jgi:hypothetical protein